MVFTIEMLRTLRGAPLAVLIALALTRQPAGAEYLARVTGYSERPTEQALKLLVDYGLAARNGRFAWQIAAQDWVTPDYIRRHAGYGERRGDPKGLVIHRMLAADPAPLSEEEQRSEYYRGLNRKYGLISDAEDNEEEEE